MFDRSFELEPNDPCLCDTGKKYKKCCRPYLKGMTIPTPETLVRARWTAYAINDSDFIMKTTHPASEHYQQDQHKWRASIRRRYILIQPHELTIISAEGNQVVYDTLVSFHPLENLRERHTATFEKHDGMWTFMDEIVVAINDEGEQISVDDI